MASVPLRCKYSSARPQGGPAAHTAQGRRDSRVDVVNPAGHIDFVNVPVLDAITDAIQGWGSWPRHGTVLGFLGRQWMWCGRP